MRNVAADYQQQQQQPPLAPIISSGGNASALPLEAEGEWSPSEKRAREAEHRARVAEQRVHEAEQRVRALQKEKEEARIKKQHQQQALERATSGNTGAGPTASACVAVSTIQVNCFYN